MWDKFLDKTIGFSFDQTGFNRHQKYFKEDFKNSNLANTNILITGATGGIGQEVARSLGKKNGNIFFTGRDKTKGELLQNEINKSQFISLDMANWEEVNKYAEAAPEFDHIVLNAGGMPSQLTTNDTGVELQCASQLIGHFLLIHRLKELNKLKKNARIVWVSSGGMYLKKLDLTTLFYQSNYDKVATYANVKRAQVTLVEELSKTSEWKDYKIISMHPGWVKTPGLKEALPVFYRLLALNLRHLSAGADTIIWSLLTTEELESGGFYFDRQKVSPYLNSSFLPSLSERNELKNRVNEYIIQTKNKHV